MFDTADRMTVHGDETKGDPGERRGHSQRRDHAIGTAFDLKARRHTSIERNGEGRDDRQRRRRRRA